MANLSKHILAKLAFLEKPFTRSAELAGTLRENFTLQKFHEGLAF
jgi:hypothetical protein